MWLERGLVYQNIKTGNLYVIITFAKHSETQEDMVVYQRLDDEDAQMWARPEALFLTKFVMARSHV